jgi:addiction module HigA family antidote
MPLRRLTIFVCRLAIGWRNCAGGRTGQHSIRVNDQWRICFRWRDGNAFEVEIVDYH